MELDGSIRIGSSNSIPDAGTIRWTGVDFEGWNGNAWISLTIQDNNPIKDIDNNTYGIVTIGTQTWMKENLRVTRFNDGTPITLVSDESVWSTLNAPGCTWWENGNGSVEFGAMYNFHVVSSTNAQNVCPLGWHIPSDVEWSTLITFFDPMADSDIFGIQSSTAGGKLKEGGLTHWDFPNSGATNESDFTGLPGGMRTSYGDFDLIGQNGFWWSSSETDSKGWARVLDFRENLIARYNYEKNFGFSVRCIKD